jgi:hypothetical protein
LWSIGGWWVFWEFEFLGFGDLGEAKRILEENSKKLGEA